MLNLKQKSDGCYFERAQQILIYIVVCEIVRHMLTNSQFEVKGSTVIQMKDVLTRESRQIALCN